MMSEEGTRVLIVEDHAVLAQGLGIVLQQLGYVTRVTDGEGGLDHILSVALEYEPAIALLDFHLGGQVGDSLPLIGPLHANGAVVIMLTGEDDRAKLGACVEAGAEGVAAKTQPLDEIIELVERGIRRESLIAQWLRAELLDA